MAAPVRIVFFNPAHNGDLFLSRPMMRDLMAKAPDAEYYCSHNCPVDLLADIPALKYHREAVKALPDGESYYVDAANGVYYINTWIGHVGTTYAVRYPGCCIQSAYDRIADSVKRLFGITLSPVAECPLSVDYTRFCVRNVDAFMAGDGRRKAFVVNCAALSMQAANFDFDPVIDHLADRFPERLFIVTNPTGVRRGNVMQSAEIIRKGGPDLMENGYVSNFCDVVIGRSSGPYTYALNEVGIRQDKTYLSFCVRPIDASLGFHDAAFRPRARFISSSNYDPDAIRALATSVVAGEAVPVNA